MSNCLRIRLLVAALSAVEVLVEVRKAGGRMKTLDFRRVVLGLLRELLAGACERLPGSVEESMVFEDNLFQIKERSRKAYDQIIPTELLSSQSFPSLFVWLCSPLIYRPLTALCRPKNSSLLSCSSYRKCSIPLMVLVYIL